MPTIQSSVARKIIRKLPPQQYRKSLDDIGLKLGIKQWSDWYNYKAEHIRQFDDGRRLLKVFRSLPSVVMNIYQNHPWEAHKFKRVERGHWKDLNNQRIYFDWIGKQLGIRTMSDWYKVTRKQFVDAGGYSLLYSPLYRGSLSKAISSVYHDYPWKMWLFNSVPTGYWNTEAHVREYMAYLADQLGIKHLDDWRLISISQVPKYGTLVKRYGSLTSILRQLYPEHPWDTSVPQVRCEKAFVSRKFKSQQYLFNRLREIFPSHELILNYNHKQLVSPVTFAQMELDIYIPSLKLAFEYQSEHHYGWHYRYGFPELSQIRDQEKKEACNRLGITLIEVPFWWNKSKTSLIATILKFRPEILPGLTAESDPIPITIPKEYKNKLRTGPPENVYKGQFNVATGRSPQAKCFVCKTQLNVKDWRAVVLGTFTPALHDPQPAQFFLCLNGKCFPSAMSYDRPSAMFLPKFGNQVHVDAQLLQSKSGDKEVPQMLEMFSKGLGIESNALHWVLD